MSDIDDVIDTLDLRGHGDIVAGMISRARAELTQLRAELQVATHTADVWERNHKQVVAELEQAKQRIAELGRTLDNAMQDAAELTAERDAARTDNRLWLDPRTIDVGALTSDSAGRR